MIDNPVLYKELVLRFRFRQQKPVLLGVGLFFLLLVAAFYWWIGVHWLLGTPTHDAGRETWTMVIIVQYLLICLVAPVITANAITLEKEQQTWEMLLFTPLTAKEVILGKLAARMVAILILLAIFLPLSLFCWAHALVGMAGTPGYVSPGQFLAAYVVMVVSALLFGTFGLLMSWRFKRTLYAIMSSYTFVIGGLIIGTVMVTSVLAMVLSENYVQEHSPLLWINPVMLMYWALDPGDVAYAPRYLLYGLLTYGFAIFLMLFVMISNFRRTSDA